MLTAVQIFASSAVYADDIQIKEANIQLAESGYRLATSFELELNHELEDALLRGIPLYFTLEAEITRPRRYWFDEKTASISQTYKISYNVLTRQYRVSVNGSLSRSFNTLEDALAAIRNPARILIAEHDALKPGETYQASVRMGLDVTQLPKPFQVNALNSSEWRISSGWKQFDFRVENR